VLGIAGAFESPALAAMLPLIAPQGSLQRATAISSGAAQIATISGPALGGLAYALAPSAAYGIMAAFFLFGSACMGAIRLVQAAVVRDAATPDDIFAGVKFVRNNPAILGTISLDLFAVLLGGATALLPIYARDILATGPWGLGLLRAAPAVGALAMSVLLARRPIQRNAGPVLFASILVFAVATILFGVSASLPLSLAALAVLGASDLLSMIIRQSLVQLRTPDGMRGRVSAVHSLFTGTSNQLGEFESGVLAAAFGAVAAVLIGGVGTMVVVAIWMYRFPELRRFHLQA
jgi:MFS family permease